MKNYPNYSFTNSLQNWYDTHKRGLPWRDISDPFRIWMSEIILQQTRVIQGLPYYEKFVNKYPTVHDLANSSEDEVLQLWQGLGYYSRGRNMLACAKAIVSDYHGKFPTNYNELVSLPGIGDYTASAVLSFAFNLPHAVLDGNVYRVLSRLYDIDIPINTPEAQKAFKTLADSLLDKNNPAKHNQAIMEFGALHCVPNKPNCGQCIFIDSCAAVRLNKVDRLPTKLKKKPKQIRYFNYFVFLQGTKVFIQKRSKKGIWKGLHQFPLFETQKSVQEADILQHLSEQYGMVNPEVLSVNSQKHLLTHQTIYADFWVVPQTSFDINRNSDIFEVELQALGTDFAIPVLLNKFLESSVITDICR